MSEDKLLTLRQRIEAIDVEILGLLNRRAQIVQEVGHVKVQTNAPVFLPEREHRCCSRLPRVISARCKTAMCRPFSVK